MAETADRAARASPRYWTAPGLRLKPRRGDSYVVVDDPVIEEEHRVAVLAVTPWPTVDERGRLIFAESGSRRLSVNPEFFQGAINQARSNDRKLVPDARDRALRIGDAFSVRGLQGGRKPSWAALEDVSTRCSSPVPS